MKRGGGMQKYPPQCGKEHLTSEGFDKTLSIKANMIDYKIKKVRRVRCIADKSIIGTWSAPEHAN